MDSNTVNSGPQKRLTLADTSAVACSQCGFDQFMANFKIRKLSRFITGEAEDSYQPIEVMNCIQCGSILYEVLPTQLQALFLKDAQSSKQPVSKDETKA